MVKVRSHGHCVTWSHDHHNLLLAKGGHAKGDEGTRLHPEGEGDSQQCILPAVQAAGVTVQEGTCVMVVDSKGCIEPLKAVRGHHSDRTENV